MPDALVTDVDRAAAGCIFSSALCALCKWRGNTVCLYKPGKLNTAIETRRCEKMASILIADAMAPERERAKRMEKALRDIIGIDDAEFRRDPPPFSGTLVWAIEKARTALKED